MRALCLALLLTACASSRGGEYRQSVRPMAPAFNPITDSPHTVGQPGYIGAPESVPRSPYTRVLPPTKEPGIWAGDGPKASREPASVLVLGITIPLPSFDEDPGLNILPAVDCMDRIESAVIDTKSLDKAGQKLIPREMYCASALALSQCLTATRETWTEGSNERRGADAAIKDVLRFIERVCPGGGRTSRSVDFAKRAADVAATTKGGTAH